MVTADAHIDGPHAVLVQEYRIGATRLTQEISLTAGSGCLEFSTRTNWRERQAMLRTSFPVAVQADEASYEIQFGHIHRPTHRNTTWDLAKDEVAAHKWADLSEHDYGVALLNDCKYGHKIKGNVIDLDLLRSVPYPGPILVKDEDVQAGEAHAGYTDQAEHAFRYALYPHQGDLIAGGVIQAGYEFNIPLRVIETDTHGGEGGRSSTIWEVEPTSIIIESVKKAEDGQGWIIRLYEASGSSVQRCSVATQLRITRATLADLLERELQPLDCSDGQIKLDFHPFEVKTVRLENGT
jgi:alpha-mannosidase